MASIAGTISPFPLLSTENFFSALTGPDGLRQIMPPGFDALI